MAHIKSALELALERTEGIKGNPEAARMKEIKISGRKTASKFMDSREADPDIILKPLKTYKKKDREAFLEGLASAFLSNIVLPRNDAQGDSLDRISEGIKVLSKDKKQVEVFMEQIKGFFEKYRENREELVSAAREQYLPRLRQKEQELRQQTGRDIQLTHEQDPEFMEFLNQNISRLDAQYSQSLDKAKEELKKFIV